MSEQAPERPRSGGNSFSKKIGPLPMWAWMAILAAAVLAFSYYKKSKSSASTGTGTSTGATSVNSPGGVDSSLVPQFVNQVYDSPQPAAAPSVTVNNTIPTPAPVTAAPPPATQPTKTASTISGAPGSYTTGLANGLNEWTSVGGYSLNTVAKSHGMTAQQLIAVSEGAENNAPLKTYVQKGNLNAPLPNGVQIFIPNANWTMKK